MKRLLIMCLCLLVLCACARAEEAEIIYERVLLRTHPGGTVLGHMDEGDRVQLLEETYVITEEPDGGLWYRVEHPTHGKGYVYGRYARPLGLGEAAEGASPAVTEGLLAYLGDLYRFQAEAGFLALAEGKHYHVLTWDTAVDTPANRLAVARLLHDHGLVVPNDAYSPVWDDAAPAEVRLAAAQALLKNHYGTDVLWEIFGRAGSNASVWVDDSDWHWPLKATAEDRTLLESHREGVLAEIN